MKVLESTLYPYLPPVHEHDSVVGKACEARQNGKGE